MKQRIGLVVQCLLSRIFRRFLGKHVYALIAKTDNGLMAIDPEDFGVGRHLLRKGRYGYTEIERLGQYVGKESKVLIVGAHIGALAIPLAKLCKKVVAIEANPPTFSLLTINLRLNQITNCDVFNVAASDQEGTMAFLANRANSGGSKRVPIKKDFMYYYDNPKKIDVRSVMLDSFLEENKFDLVVMDIEGSEYFALKGMQYILGNSQVLAVEFLPHHLENVSGVTVEQFLSVIMPHFASMTIPTKKLKVDSSHFLEQLNAMCLRDEGDEGLIFEKTTNDFLHS